MKGIKKMGLVVKRAVGQDVWIGDIRVLVTDVQGKACRILIEAPSGTQILRGELIKSPDDLKPKAPEDKAKIHIGSLTGLWTYCGQHWDFGMSLIDGSSEACLRLANCQHCLDRYLEGKRR